MSCGCNHGPNGGSSHHHCSAPAPIQLSSSSPVPPQPVAVHHCDTDYIHSAPYYPQCHPSSSSMPPPSHPPQCTCNDPTGHHTPSSPHPTDSPHWFHSHSPSPAHHHTPISHHPSPHIHHVSHTPTSHHPPSHSHTSMSHHSSHPNTPTSHQHPSHSHTPTSHHHSSHPHTPTSHHHPSHSHTPTSHHHSSHPHTPTSHNHSSHHPSSPRAPLHSPHTHTSSHHHPPSLSPHHHPSPTSRIIPKPLYTASPLHHSHTWNSPSSPTFHTTCHRIETHPLQSSGCCGNSTCAGLPPKICQVHPTRRQLIPSSSASSCLEGGSERGDHHPSHTQQQFITETPPQATHPMMHRHSESLHVSGSSGSMFHNVPQDTRVSVGVGVLTPQASEYQHGVTHQVDTDMRSVTTNQNTVASATIHSTPPPNLRNSRVQVQQSLEFSPYDCGPNDYSSEFQLATPIINTSDVNIPVNHVQIPQEHHQYHLSSERIGTSDSFRYSPASSPTPNPPSVQALRLDSSSLPLSSRANQLTDTDTHQYPLNSDLKKGKRKKSLCLDESTSSKMTGSIPLVKPLMMSPFSGHDEKIGREAVILEHCTAISGIKIPPLNTTTTSIAHNREEPRNNGEEFCDSDSESLIIESSSQASKENGETLREKEMLQMYVSECVVKDEDMNTSKENFARKLEKEAEMCVEAENDGHRMSRRARGLVASAKLASDSEISQSESEIVFGADKITKRKRSSLARRQRQCRSDKENKDDSSTPAIIGQGEREEEEEEEREVVKEIEMVLDSEDSEDDLDNNTLIAVKMENNPISTRTRSHTDSSQSDSDFPHVPSQRMSRSRKQRSKLALINCQPPCLETSQSESECSAIPTLSSSSQSSQSRLLKSTKTEVKGQVNDKQEVKGQMEPTDVETETDPLENGDSSGLQHLQIPSEIGQNEGMMSSTVPMTSSSDPPMISSTIPMTSSSNPPMKSSMTSSPTATSVPSGQVSLSEWYIRIMGKNLVIVEGIKNNNKKRTWHSGPIVKRLAPRLVATRSGTTYHLEGPLNHEELEKLEIGELAIQFEDGFPENWLSVIHEYLLKKILSNKDKNVDLQKSERKDTVGERVWDESEEGEKERTEHNQKESVIEGDAEEMVRESEGGRGEKEGECEESDDSVIKKRTRKRVRRRRIELLLDEDSASDRCDEGEERRGRRREVSPLVKMSISNTAVHQLEQATTTMSEAATTDDEQLQLKTEEEEEGVRERGGEGEGRERMSTPQAIDNGAASEFISSLKRSSRGRTLKPASSSVIGNSMDIYSYDMRGNFIGLASPVIDLTLSDTSGFIASGNESILMSYQRKQTVKREPVTTSEKTEGEGEGGDGSIVSKVKEERKKRGVVQKRGGGGVKNKQKKQRKRTSVIPTGLRKVRRPVVQCDETSTECDVSEANEGEGGGEEKEKKKKTEYPTEDGVRDKRATASRDKQRDESESDEGGSEINNNKNNKVLIDTESISRNETEKRTISDTEEIPKQVPTKKNESVKTTKSKLNASKKIDAKHSSSKPVSQQKKDDGIKSSFSKTRDSDTDSVPHKSSSMSKRGAGNSSESSKNLPAPTKEKKKKKKRETRDDNNTSKKSNLKLTERERDTSEGEEGGGECVKQDRGKTPSANAAKKKKKEKKKKRINCRRFSGSEQTETESETESRGVVHTNQEIAGEDYLVVGGSKRNGTKEGGASRGAITVKEHHREVKKRVSICNEVTVMGGGIRERRKEDDEKWSPTELNKLGRAVLAVPALADNFWEQVARRLGSGRSAEACGKEYAKLGERGKKRKKAILHVGQAAVAKEKNTCVSPPALTAKVGTMKRKRQVRDILEHLDDGHIDDYFGSTPFKKSKIRRRVEELENEDESDSDTVAVGDDHLLTTPYGVGSLRERLGVDETHTPTLCDYGSTPDYKGRQTQGAADHVIYKQQHKPKKGSKTAQLRQQPTSKTSTHTITHRQHSHQQMRNKPDEPSTSSHHLHKHHHHHHHHQPERNLHSIRGGETTMLRRFDDSDDDSCDSNPFSDMEDVCQDVISRLH